MYRTQTYSGNDRLRAIAEEEPVLSNFLRFLECASCCSDRTADTDWQSPDMGLRSVWDMHAEETVGSTFIGSDFPNPTTPTPRSGVSAGDSPDGFPEKSNFWVDTPDALVEKTNFSPDVSDTTDSGCQEEGRGYPDPEREFQESSIGQTSSSTSFLRSWDGLEERGPIEIEGGFIYTGQWRGDVRQGYGVLERPADGIRFIGSFLNSKAHGRGTLSSPDGSTYEGEWIADHMHGYGKYIDADGSTYEGEWRNDAKFGRGIECYADGARYEGEFWMGGKHGAGIYRSSAGVEYEGQYSNDKMEGEGRYRFEDGRIYSGQWSAGHMQGMGKMTWPNGSTFAGGYRMDRKHGPGTFKWPDGRMYIGQWHKGQLHGRGTQIHADAEEEAQQWSHGQRMSLIATPSAAP